LPRKLIANVTANEIKLTNGVTIAVHSNSFRLIRGRTLLDVSALFDEQVIEDAVGHARPLELPPRSGRRYFAFTDSSAGRHDAFTICIGHTPTARRTRQNGLVTLLGHGQHRLIHALSRMSMPS
jgi:hypothetical protein